MFLFSIVGITVVSLILADIGSLLVFRGAISLVLFFIQSSIRPLSYSLVHSMLFLDGLSILIVIITLLVMVISLVCRGKDFNIRSVRGKGVIEVRVLIVVCVCMFFFSSSS